jgi:3',5'-cyclic AMP phosphodiesterase CpdA
MIEIYHISDMHFSKNESFNEGANSLIAAIKKDFFPKSDINRNRYLLVTGDVTDSGSRAEYLLALEALIPFKERIFVVPGNHDYGALRGTDFDPVKAMRFDSPFAESLGVTHSFFNKFKDETSNSYTPYTRELNDGDGTKVLLIGLNSCRNEGVMDFAQGEIGATQLKNLDKILTNADPKISKILFLHHIPTGEADFSEVMSLIDWKQLVQTISNRVDVFAFGHQSFKQKNDSWVREGRKMQIRMIENRYILDADSSVDEQSCYLITINKDNVTVEVKVLGERLARVDTLESYHTKSQV